MTQLIPTNQIDPPPRITGRPDGPPHDQTKPDRGHPIASTPLPRCADSQPLTMFKDTRGGFKNNEPSQLIEYTLGAINHDKDPVELNPHNVDLDVSYGDTAVLPAVMVPFNTVLPADRAGGLCRHAAAVDTLKAGQPGGTLVRRNI